jgi:hypothetical protein
MRWYDPIFEVWHDPPAPKAVEVVKVEEDVYARANRINRERSIWEAVTATAQASQQGET